MMIAVELHISFAVDGEKMSQIKCNNGWWWYGGGGTTRDGEICGLSFHADALKLMPSCC